MYKRQSMPCFGTTDRTYDNACRLARTLGTTLSEVNIREAVSLHFRDIGQDSDVHDVTFENSQARERTQVLMDIANRAGGLVIEMCIRDRAGRKALSAGLICIIF